MIKHKVYVRKFDDGCYWMYYRLMENKIEVSDDLQKAYFELDAENIDFHLHTTATSNGKIHKGGKTVPCEVFYEGPDLTCPTKYLIDELYAAAIPYILFECNDE